MATDSKPVRVAGVVRVSSEKQKQEASLDTQEAAIRKTCAEKGFAEPKIYRFVEKATKRGLDPEERKQFERLLQGAVADEYDFVMVYHPSRLARSQEDGAKAIRILNACVPRKDIYVLGDRKYINTAAGRQAMGFATVQAEGESDYLRERVMINKFAAAERGRYSCRLPWGLKQDKQTLQWSKVPGTQAIADRIYDLIVRQGYSGDDVAKKLGHVNRKKDGIVTKQVWRQRIDQFCVPHLTLEKYETGEKRTFYFPDAPKRWTEVQMAQVQKRWDANSTMGKGRKRRKGYEDYILSGKLKCSCGTTITGVPRGKRREYQHGNAQIKGPKCSYAVPANAIEEDVFAQLSQILRSRNLPQLILKSQQAAGRVDFDALIDHQRKELERIERNRSELIRLKSKMKDIDPKALRTFGNELSKMSSEQTAVEAKLADLEQEQTETSQRKTRAQETADLLSYLAADARRWKDRNNQLTLLDACFGIGNLKGKEPGIYVTKKTKPNGRCDYIPTYRFAVDLDQAVQTLAAQAKPGELGRPFLPSKRIRHKEPHVITSISSMALKPRSVVRFTLSAPEALAA